MGADGGSIPDRRDLVRTKGKAEITDRALLRELFFFCALSKNLLSRPVVLDPIGKLYNKDALIEYFLDKSTYGDGDQICGHLKGVKDLLTLSLTDNPQYVATSTSTTALASDKAPFICPLSLKEMNGAIPFIALRNCGCVFSDNAIRSVVPNLSRGTAASAVISDDKAEQAKPIVEAQDKVACPNCTKEFDPTPANSILPINPSKNVQDALMDQLLISRAAAKSSKKRKAAVADTAVDGVQKVNGDGVVDGDIPKKAARKSEVPHRSTASPASNPTADGKSTLHRSVHQKLAEQEQKRLAAQAGMSDAVKAMFKPKEEEKRGGAAEFFGRTFNRYAI